MNVQSEKPLGQNELVLDETVSLLAQCRYFKTMPSEVLHRVLKNGTLIEVPPGTLLIKEGDQDRDFFILLEGSLEVRSESKIILRLDSLGDIIGEMAVISDAPRSADVIAVLPSRLVQISSTVLHSSPPDPVQSQQLLTIFSHIMAAKLGETSKRARLYESSILEAREIATSNTKLESEIQDKLQEIALYSKIIEKSNDAVLIANSDGIVERFNPAALALFKNLIREPGGLGGISMVALMKDFDVGDYPQRAPEEPWQGEWSQGAGDDRFFLQVTVSPLPHRDKAGKAVLAFQFRNITLQKTQERELERRIAERTQEVRSLLDNMDEGIFTITANGEIQPGYSGATGRILGNISPGDNFLDLLNLEPQLRKTIEDTLHLLVTPDIKLDWDDMLSFMPNEFEPSPSSWVRAQFRPIFDSRGARLDCIMVVLKDITVEKALWVGMSQTQAKQEMVFKILQDRENFEMFYRDSVELLRNSQQELREITVAQRGTIDSLFRTVHTIKGTGAVFGLSEVTEKAHAIEDSLRLLRENRDTEISVEQKKAIMEGLQTLRDQLTQARDTVRELIGEGESEERSFTISEPKIDRICREVLARIAPVQGTEVESILYSLKKIPILRLLKKFRSLVAQIAEKLDKKVQLEIEDPHHTEFTLEFFSHLDPLFLHIIRNTIDHGIEEPEERLEAGKDVAGKISLKFFLSDGGIKIMISDDGRGIDTEHLREVGLERGFIKPEKAESMSREDLLKLLFIPGFSTAKTVTDLSGRGVGLDVVKTELEKLGGEMLLTTKTGEGTLFEFQFPFSPPTTPLKN